MENLRICAIIAVRNEYYYLKILLPYLYQQKIDVVILDNESDDNSNLLFQQKENNPIVNIVKQTYKGHYSQTDQLEAKQKIIKNLEAYDWVIHHDADEIIEHYNPNSSIRDAIAEADCENYNVINLEEFVFLPETKKSYVNENYYELMKRYYFFEPNKNRLNRIWKINKDFSNTNSGGHHLTGNQIRIFPKNHVLRHYITLSQEHLYDKYIDRKFDQIDLNKKWHTKRLNLKKNDLILPDQSPNLKFINSNKDSLDRSLPLKNHFWFW